MRMFNCSCCGGSIVFEDAICEACGSRLGFVPELADMCAFNESEGKWLTLPSSSASYKPCRNYVKENVCNWMMSAEASGDLCQSCRLTAVIPNLNASRRHYFWSRMESAKRRLLYTLASLGLQVESQGEKDRSNLRFEFLESKPGKAVLTGHHRGLVTMNIAEADDVCREQTRIAMHEPYRTLLGHFRHESGHYFFDPLVTRTGNLSEFRKLFGDERRDYGEALSCHYEAGAPANWSSTHISAYATMHPWEDWAESWAHYLHIVDTVDTASAWGIRVRSNAEPGSEEFDSTPANRMPFDALVKHWVRLAPAINSLNRSLGMPDPYPFSITQPVACKLGFVHRVITMNMGRA